MAGQHLFMPDQPPIHPSNSEHLLCEGTFDRSWEYSRDYTLNRKVSHEIKKRLLFWLPSLEPDLQELIGVHQIKKKRSFKVGKKG